MLAVVLYEPGAGPELYRDIAQPEETAAQCDAPRPSNTVSSFGGTSAQKQDMKST